MRPEIVLENKGTKRWRPEAARVALETWLAGVLT
jgi:hypothetical protein